MVRFEQRAPKDNRRYVVTKLDVTPATIYELYRERGDVENRIKELKGSLYLDRTSCTRFWAHESTARAADGRHLRAAARAAACPVADAGRRLPGRDGAPAADQDRRQDRGIGPEDHPSPFGESSLGERLDARSEAPGLSQHVGGSSPFGKATSTAPAGQGCVQDQRVYPDSATSLALRRSQHAKPCPKARARPRNCRQNPSQAPHAWPS